MNTTKEKVLLGREVETNRFRTNRKQQKKFTLGGYLEND